MPRRRSSASTLFFFTACAVFVDACAYAAVSLPVSVASSSLSACLGVSAFSSSAGFSFRIGFGGRVAVLLRSRYPLPPLSTFFSKMLIIVNRSRTHACIRCCPFRTCGPRLVSFRVSLLPSVSFPWRPPPASPTPDSTVSEDAPKTESTAVAHTHAHTDGDRGECEKNKRDKQQDGRRHTPSLPHGYGDGIGVGGGGGVGGT